MSMSLSFLLDLGVMGGGAGGFPAPLAFNKASPPRRWEDEVGTLVH